MSERYPGGFITKNTPVTTQTSASGVWTLDQAMQATKAGNWPVNGPFYIEDVFSTWLYTGTGGSGGNPVIVNGIDLAGKGGLVWFKDRTAVTNHALFDTVRGVGPALSSNTTTGNTTGFPLLSFTITASASQTTHLTQTLLAIKLLHGHSASSLNFLML
jgi:hypothetical protein